VSEYALPRRRPMCPRSTPSSHCSPSTSKVGPSFATSARWSAPLPVAASQARTSLRFFADFCQIACAQRSARPGLARMGCNGTAPRRSSTPGTTWSGRAGFGSCASSA
jgi:hypothetical protein